MATPQIAIIFDNKLRPDTTGMYCRRALDDLTGVHHYLPSEFDRMPRTGFDLYLFIDDGLEYAIPDGLNSTAFWAIDTHLDFARSLRRARGATHVFAAQKDGAQNLRNAGVAGAVWLPLAADPEIHQPHAVEKKIDVCFVGHPFEGPRNDLVRLIQRRFPNTFVGQKYFDDMAETYSASRIVFNRSLKNDVNMRVFEALACGSMLLTNAIDDNGQTELFHDGVDLATYNGPDELVNKIQFYLDHADERERIANRGREVVVTNHTYHQRMRTILESVLGTACPASMPGAQSVEPSLASSDTSRSRQAIMLVDARENPLIPALSPQGRGEGASSATRERCPYSEPVDDARENPLTSIILVTHNELEYTRLCIGSIRERTTEPYELIIVDNGSTDGTVDYARSIPNVKVIANSENRGFPAAVNQGIAVASGQYILLLNNDTIVTTRWLERMLIVFESDPKMGLVGPCSNCVSGIQQIPVTYTQLDQLENFASDWGRTHDREVVASDRLVGFCLLIRRDVVNQIGLFDEQFGVGNFEDDDFCRRAMQAGYLLGVATSAFVHHFGSRTFIGTGTDLKNLLMRNERKFNAKWRISQAALSPPLPQGSAGRDLPVDPSALAASRQKPFRLRAGTNSGLYLERVAPLLSLCMIVRNNESTIRASLESIRPWVDEMIVVDTGSTDSTPEICRELGAQVFHWAWRDDFSAARNESLAHAKGEWCFWMDSDDTISEECGRKLRALAYGQHDRRILGFVIQVHCPGPNSDGPLDATAVDHVKLIRNRSDLRFEHRIHEQILPAIRRAEGDVAFTDIHVIHSGADHSAEGRARKLERDFKLLHLDLRERPDHPFVLFNFGMTHTEAQQYVEAVHWLTRCLEVSQAQESHVRKAYALLISNLMQLRDHERAEMACQRGRSLFPNDKELLFRQAMLCHEIGKLDEAATIYREVMRPAGERHFASVDLGLAGYKARQNLALVYETQGRFDLAKLEWRTIADEKLDYIPAQVGLTECLVQCGNDHEAEIRIEKLRGNPRTTAEGSRLAARLTEKLHGIAAAIRELERGLRDCGEEVGLLREFARLQHDSHNYTAALETLERLTLLAPTDASAWHNRGVILGLLGRQNEAQIVIARAQSLRN